jgi:hypothetical protein
MNRMLPLLFLASTTALGCVAGTDSTDPATQPDEDVGEAREEVTASNQICSYTPSGAYCDIQCWRLSADGIGSTYPYTASLKVCDAAPPPSHFRTIYSEALISRWATFFNGESGDTAINAGVSMPSGCEVVYVQGVHYHGTTPIGAPAASVTDGGHGFTAYSTSSATRGLDMGMHWWHDGVSSIKVRAAYVIKEPNGVDCSVPGATRSTCQRSPRSAGI